MKNKVWVLLVIWNSDFFIDVFSSKKKAYKRLAHIVSVGWDEAYNGPEPQKWDKRAIKKYFSTCPANDDQYILEEREIK